MDDSPKMVHRSTKERIEDVEKRCKRELIEISERNNKDVNIDLNLSQYAKTKDGEFFAEVFANSQLGKPNELGVAMLEWLERNGFYSMLSLIEIPYFMTNDEWFYFDEKEHCLKLTEKAPPKAIKSYKKFYKRLNNNGWLIIR